MRRSERWLVLLALGLCATALMPQAALADGPDLTLDMARSDAITGPLPVGAEAVFRLTVTNVGTAGATGVKVTDTLPDGLTLVSAPGCTSAGRVVSCTTLPISPIDHLHLFLHVRAEPSAAERTLTNEAVVTSAEPDDAPASNAASLAFQIGPYSVLEATTTTAAVPVAAGSSATFGATVRNDGPSAASGVRLIDLLPEGLRLRSATSSQGACAGAVCDLGGLPAGASAQIRIVADVDAAAGGRRVNAVEVTATSPSRAARAEAAFEIRPTAPVTLPPAAAQAVDVAVRVRPPARATEGAAGEWRIDVINEGRVAAAGVTLTGAANLPVDLVGAREAQAGCGNRLPFSCALGSLAAGERRTFVLILRPRAAGRLTLRGRVAAIGAETARADNLDRASVRVAPGRARATVGVTADAASVREGGTVGLAITVRNLGRITARRLEVCVRPSGALEITRAVGARIRSGRACWTLPSLPPGAGRRYRATARALAGDVPPAATATLRGANVTRATARAGVSLLREAAAPTVSG